MSEEPRRSPPGDSGEGEASSPLDGFATAPDAEATPPAASSARPGEGGQDAGKQAASFGKDMAIEAATHGAGLPTGPGMEMVGAAMGTDPEGGAPPGAPQEQSDPRSAARRLATAKEAFAGQLRGGDTAPAAARGDRDEPGTSLSDRLKDKLGDLGAGSGKDTPGDAAADGQEGKLARLKHDAGVMAGQAAGKAADEYAKKAAAAAWGVPPQVTQKALDATRKVLNTKTGQKFLNRSVGGKILNSSKFGRSVKEGLGIGGKKSQEQGPGDAAGQGDAAGKVLRSKWTLGVVFVVLVSMLLVALLDGNATDRRNQVQPDQKAEKIAAEYIPPGWLTLLKKAADSTLDEEDWAVVPWTILAGIAKAQTDFGRFSPYDDADRDPDRRTKDVGGGGGGGGGADVPIGPTTGAGPGPIEGVTGPGNNTSLSPDHPAPPAGNLSQQLGWYVWALRMHESETCINKPGGQYKCRNAQTGACGAYQYLKSTWNNYKGYATACDAPAAVQDRRKIEDVLKAWNRYHQWQKITMAHYYPAWANSPEKWNQKPGPSYVDNPTAWGFVDDVMNRMRKAAQIHPPGSGPDSDSPAPSGSPRAAGLTGGAAVRQGVFAGDCEVKNPDPEIGGKDGQGVGPFLLTPAAADLMEDDDLDPHNPCDAADWVADRLAETALAVHRDANAPEWKPNGDAKDMENARKYWRLVIERSGIFMDRSASTGQACVLPPDDAQDERYRQSVSYKIVYLWSCTIARASDLYLVTGGAYGNGGAFDYKVEQDRRALTRILVDEALGVSYAASKWKTEGCDNGSDDRQGIFPMTKQEAKAAGVQDRCDAAANIVGAARLVVSGEQVKVAARPKDKGVYQPMLGGWAKLGIALGRDADLFATVGPGTDFEPTDSCTRVMTGFLTKVAPQAGAFAALTDPPQASELGSWQQKLQQAAAAAGAKDPSTDPACVIGSWAPGYNGALAQLAADLAAPTSTGLDAAARKNLDGLGNYYLAEERALKPKDPVPGEDSLVIPRLAPKPLKEINAPIDPDALDAYSDLGGSNGPLGQKAVEYAWFFGGVIAPFDSAGKRIGSLADGSGPGGPGGGDGGAGDGSGPPQVEVGPDGCPVEAPRNTLREGSAKIGVQKLCVDSVDRAATPEAAKAIKWALTHLGWPYSQPKRMVWGWADCSSFTARAYKNGAGLPVYRGWAPTTYTWIKLSGAKHITYGTAKPGDLVLPRKSHIAMQLTHGYKVHTNIPGDVSKVERAYSSVNYTLRIVPDQVKPWD
ncbi:hypothetical protein [Bailinhaonella thermotolerans]|uniref:NlpC/P60 domain-containing protein n=1 Tax=Bailinhaonella thermotolerans TaxID=1070861 RepID=A0A3A4ABY9_9ACTN|nr:hypothetical protein [Bailinhaonella thermotolerans]RJL24024.1 hypothetical protein D5H75_31860 [Bailinhaonella thermotolerans]